MVGAGARKEEEGSLCSYRLIRRGYIAPLLAQKRFGLYDAVKHIRVWSYISYPTSAFVLFVFLTGSM